MVLSALTKLDLLDKEAKKIRPDQRSLDSDGKVISETYSAAKFDEVKRSRDLLGRWS